MVMHHCSYLAYVNVIYITTFIIMLQAKDSIA